jgi:hypothetical protein
MCIFCQSERTIIETVNIMENRIIEHCENCEGKVTINRNNGKMLISNFPKKDRIIRIALLFAYLLLMLLSISRIYNIITSYITIMILIVAVIIVAAYIVFCNFLNMRNYKRFGYMYYGIINVITKNGDKLKLRLLIILNYIVRIFGILFIIFMSYIFYWFV